MVLKAQVQDCIAMFDMKQTLKVAKTVYVRQFIYCKTIHNGL